MIEFLSAFTLFLMILTAFLSLAQLQMGSNDPDVDRLDRAAAVGLDRLTSGPGWFVPMDGGLDYGNATEDWHLHDAASLDNGRVQPGLLLAHRLDMDRIEALHNVTEEGMAQGLGLADDMSLHLTVQVVESNNASRVGELLFRGGTDRTSAPSSSTSYRSFQQEGELIRVVLEVHDGGRKANQLHLTEVMTRPSANGPEWLKCSIQMTSLLPSRDGRSTTLPAQHHPMSCCRKVSFPVNPSPFLQEIQPPKNRAMPRTSSTLVKQVFSAWGNSADLLTVRACSV